MTFDTVFLFAFAGGLMAAGRPALGIIVLVWAAQRLRTRRR